MPTAPINIYRLRSLVEQRFASIAAQEGKRPIGRRAALEVVLVAAKQGVTIGNIAGAVNRHYAAVKKAVAALVIEGMIIKDGQTQLPNGQQPDIYVATPLGKETGSNYKVTPISSLPADPGWGVLGSVRLAMLRGLLAMNDLETATMSQIMHKAGIRSSNRSSVDKNLKFGITKGYIQWVKSGKHYSRYRLTPLGRTMASEYVQRYATAYTDPLPPD